MFLAKIATLYIYFIIRVSVLGEILHGVDFLDLVLAVGNKYS